MVEDKREKNYSIINQVNNFNPNGASEYNTLLGQKNRDGNGFFMTEAKQKENNQEEYNPPVTTYEDTKLKLYRSTRQARTYSGQLERGQPWRNLKKRTTTKLRIDADRNKIPIAPTAIPLDKNQLLLEELISKRPKGGIGTTHFLPTHKVRKHPQLEKIEQYFVSLKSFIFRGTAMKILFLTLLLLRFLSCSMLINMQRCKFHRKLRYSIKF